MEVFNQYRGLNKEIYVLAITKCINMMGLMFVFPMTSLLITQVLGYTPVQAGYFALAYSVAIAVSNAIGGKLSDKMSRRKIMVACYLIIIACMLIASVVCRTPYVLIFILLAQAFNGAAQPPISALVLDKCPYIQRTESISLLYLASNIGSALGPILAGRLFYNHLPLVFICMAIAYIITTIITVFMVTDLTSESSLPLDSTTTLNQSKNKKQEGYLTIILKNPVLFTFIVVLGLSTFCYSSFGYMLPLHFASVLGPEKGPAAFSWIWTINGAIIVFTTPFIIRFTKKFSQLTNTAASCILYALAYGIYASTERISLYYMAVSIWTIAEILISTGAAVFIASESPDTHKGRSMAAYEFARSAGRSIGPTIFGFLIMYRSYSITWRLNMGISLALFFIMLILIYAVKHRKEQNT